jgi:hypothetical protein
MGWAHQQNRQQRDSDAGCTKELTRACLFTKSTLVAKWGRPLQDRFSQLRHLVFPQTAQTAALSQSLLSKREVFLAGRCRKPSEIPTPASADGSPRTASADVKFEAENTLQGDAEVERQVRFQVVAGAGY